MEPERASGVAVLLLRCGAGLGWAERMGAKKKKGRGVSERHFLGHVRLFLVLVVGGVLSCQGRICYSLFLSRGIELEEGGKI